MMIPYENLERLNRPFAEDFKIAFADFLSKGHYIMGGQLEAFENEFAAYNALKYCVGVSNGLDALILALRALELPAGSEVIVPSNTYIASILAVIGAGLKPVLAEPDLKTYNIDPFQIENAITPDTRAVLVVHLYGKMCDMDAIMNIKEKHKLYLIEDCAQAHGATYKGRMAGSFGEMAAFSFYPTKNLGALGDGGAVVTNSEAYRKSLMLQRNYGSDRKYYNDVVGYNNRLDELQAAMLRIKLRKLNEMNEHRNKLADLYKNNLNSSFIQPVSDPDYYDVFHIFNIRHPQRDELQRYLAEKGVGTVIHYPVPPHRQLALKAYFQGNDFPVADEIHNTTLSIPCSFSHSEDEIRKTIEVLNSF